MIPNLGGFSGTRFVHSGEAVGFEVEDLVLQWMKRIDPDPTNASDNCEEASIIFGRLIRSLAI
jgi:hypothetical protein